MGVRNRAFFIVADAGSVSWWPTWNSSNQTNTFPGRRESDLTWAVTQVLMLIEKGNDLIGS
jgi:hypothetical protein